MSRFLFLIFIGLQGLSIGAVIPLPQSLFDVNKIVREVKNPYFLKLGDLKKNYRTLRRSQVLEFSSHEKVLCQGKERVEESVLSRLEYIHRDGLDSIRLYDCEGDLRLEEVLTVTGGQRKPLMNWTEAQLDLKLRIDEKSLFYQLKDPQGEVLLEVQGRRLSEKSEIYDLIIGGARYLTLRSDLGLDLSRMTYHFYGVSLNYRYKNLFTQSFNVNFGSGFSLKVQAKKNEVQYLNSRNKLLAQNTFLSYFGSYALDYGIRQLKGPVEYQIGQLPPTNVVAATGTSNRLVEELRLNLNRLLNNINLNLLELFFRELIRASESGQIIDRRS